MGEAAFRSLGALADAAASGVEVMGEAEVARAPNGKVDYKHFKALALKELGVEA